MKKKYVLNKSLVYFICSMFISILVLFILNLTFKIELVSQIRNLEIENRRISERALSLYMQFSELEKEYKTIADYKIRKILATAYNSTPAQTDNDPFITANGSIADHNTLALSRDLIFAENGQMNRMGYNPEGIYCFGDTVYVIYVKQLVIKDTMNKRYFNRADLWTDDYGIARKWGIREVYIYPDTLYNKLFIPLAQYQYNVHGIVSPMLAMNRNYNSE
ncbi:MAG: hypothetical protein ISS81_06920 [Candidatus Marinimicrobia bacterium]|nr:hypothetical protein [Candidatus Neomarinimicrobiota bacterium]